MYSVKKSYRSLTDKIQHGLKVPDNQRILHTAPHHDDIELAYFPLIHHLVRSPNNENYFVYCTSGFTAVTNYYVIERLENLRDQILYGNQINEEHISNLADYGNAQDDITGYLNGIASQDKRSSALSYQQAAHPVVPESSENKGCIKTVGIHRESDQPAEGH